MSDADLSAIFDRHAFDPWHPSSRGRDCSVVMDREAFYEGVREAIAAETRKLVDALRPMSDVNARLYGYPTRAECDEAARLVAEYDAQQRPALGDGQAAFDAAQKSP